MQSYDVIVVGGGIAGLASAWHLARAGVTRTCIVERDWACGTQATGTNAAIFRHLDFDAASIGLARRSRALMEVLAPRLVRETGALYLASPQRLQRARALLAAQGLATELLVGDELARRFTILAGVDGAAPPGVDGLLLPSDGVIDVHALVEALVRQLRAAGVTLRLGAAAVSVSPGAGGHEVRLFTGDVLFGQRLVVAAGAWSAEVASLRGLPLPIEPRRRHLALLEPEAPLPPSHPVVWRLEREVYFRAESGGVLASPCDEEPCPPGIVPTAPEQLAQLGQRLSEVAPALSTATVRRAWGCLRSFAPDREFVVGADERAPGLHWLAGLGGRGMTCGLALGEVLAAAVQERTHPLLEPLSPARLWAAFDRAAPR
jgi:glycine/D-amino acid oxidase-like deaminating enzyme